MKVKILVGAYGRHVGKIVKPVYQGEIVDLETSEAEYLVETGAAEYIPEAVGEAIPEPEAEGTGGNLPEEAEDEEEAILATTDRPLEELSFSELKRVAAQIGIEDLGKYRSKAALIAVIMENTLSVEDIPDAPPEITASEVM